MGNRVRLRVQVPGEAYYKDLVSCQVACPVHTDARGYIRAVAAGRFEEAYLIARGPNPLASICGRVCGAPCEAACRRGRVPRVDDDGRFVASDRPIAIRAIKRFACEGFGPEARDPGEVLRALRDHVPPVLGEAEEMAALVRSSAARMFRPADGEPVAIIGAGPAGLAAAHDLALLGLRPIVFEAEPLPAGMLVLGVPSYRLPRDLVAREIDVIGALGAEIRCGIAVGRDISLADLRRSHRAVIVAAGAKASRSLGLPGERGPRVYGGVDLLRAVALGSPIDIGQEVVVIGGGNVAYDVARTVLRQIAYDTARTAARLPGIGRVHLVSLETLEEMPADTEEIIEGDAEGIRRRNGWGPVEIRRGGDGSVRGVLLRRCLRVYDEKRRFSPIFDDAAVEEIPCDTVLLAVGQATDLGFLRDGGGDVELVRPGWPKVDTETLATTAPGVFVAGDLAHGTRLLIDAVASGKAAARSVYRHVTGRAIERDAVTVHIPLERYRRERGYEAIRRVPIPATEPEERLRDPAALVEIGYDGEEARREASRCLDCGVTPVFDGTRCVLCGGCVDVCPTQCLKLAGLDEIEPDADFERAVEGVLGRDADPEASTVILKDEDRCIRCALCAMRCPVDAIAMERVTVSTCWRHP